MTIYATSTEYRSFTTTAAQRINDVIVTDRESEYHELTDEQVATLRQARDILDALAERLAPRCLNCGRELDEQPTGRPKVYCSDSCRNEAHRAKRARG